MTTKLPDPRCVRCWSLAADMAYLDSYWADSLVEVAAMEEDERQKRRVEYARTDGTYNSASGFFWCDPCYIVVGSPPGKAP